MEAVIPAIAAVIAAIIAAVAARSAHRSQAALTRQLEAERRLADKKVDVYADLVEGFGTILRPGSTKQDQDRLLPAIQKFATWAPIYGSDDLVLAGHNMMQVAFSGTPPPTIALRYYAEFILAVRRDLGNVDTELTPTVILGMRVNDLYAKDGIAAKMDMALPELEKVEGWTPPWRR